MIGNILSGSSWYIIGCPGKWKFLFSRPSIGDCGKVYSNAVDARSLLKVNCRSTGEQFAARSVPLVNASTASRRYCANFVELEFIPFLENFA